MLVFEGLSLAGKYLVGATATYVSSRPTATTGLSD